MSAKNRGGESVAFDHYATPKKNVRAILGAILPTITRRGTHDDFDVLDPCCGEGAVLEVVKEFGYHDIQGIELQPHLAEQACSKGFSVQVADALSPSCVWSTVKLIVSNPPYTHAADFLRKSLETVGPQGHVTFLLRLGFLASAARRELFEEIGMPDTKVIPRPSFCMTVACRECGDRYTLPPDAERPKVCRNFHPEADYKLSEGEISCINSARPAISTTDAADYAWMTWGPEFAGHVSRLEVE